MGIATQDHFLPNGQAEWEKPISAFATSTVWALARVTNSVGAYITHTAISLVTVDLFQIDGESYARTPVDSNGIEITDGSPFASPAVTSVVFDTLQTDVRWTKDSIGYNVAYGVAMPDADTLYELRITLTATNGDTFVVGMRINSK